MGGGTATLFGFYNRREEGPEWQETMQQSAYKDHLLRGMAPVWALGKERNLEEALALRNSRRSAHRGARRPRLT